MHDYNTRKLFQDLYSIFFNLGTKHCAESIPFVLEPTIGNKNPADVGGLEKSTLNPRSDKVSLKKVLENYLSSENASNGQQT